MLFSLPTDESLVDLRLPERRLDSRGDFPVSDAEAFITIWLWLVQSIDLIDKILPILPSAKFYTEFDMEHQRIGFALAKERRVTFATEVLDGNGHREGAMAKIRDDVPKKFGSLSEIDDGHSSGQLVVLSVFGTLGVVILG